MMSRESQKKKTEKHGAREKKAFKNNSNEKRQEKKRLFNEFITTHLSEKKNFSVPSFFFYAFGTNYLNRNTYTGGRKNLKRREEKKMSDQSYCSSFHNTLFTPPTLFIFFMQLYRLERELFCRLCALHISKLCGPSNILLYACCIGTISAENVRESKKRRKQSQV